MSSLQSYYPFSKITVVWRLILSFASIPFSPTLRRDWVPLLHHHPSPPFVNQYSLDQGTSIMALYQQGAFSLNKIQVWKILEDERDTVTPLGVLFLSQRFSQLNICASAVGLRRPGALPRLSCDQIHYNLLWWKSCRYFFVCMFLLYIFLCSMRLNIP